MTQLKKGHLSLLPYVSVFCFLSGIHCKPIIDNSPNQWTGIATAYTAGIEGLELSFPVNRPLPVDVSWVLAHWAVAYFIPVSVRAVLDTFTFLAVHWLKGQIRLWIWLCR